MKAFLIFMAFCLAGCVPQQKPRLRGITFTLEEASQCGSGRKGSVVTVVGKLYGDDNARFNEDMLVFLGQGDESVGNLGNTLEDRSGVYFQFTNPVCKTKELLKGSSDINAKFYFADDVYVEGTRNPLSFNNNCIPLRDYKIRGDSHEFVFDDGKGEVRFEGKISEGNYEGVFKFKYNSDGVTETSSIGFAVPEGEVFKSCSE